MHSSIQFPFGKAAIVSGESPRQGFYFYFYFFLWGRGGSEEHKSDWEQWFLQAQTSHITVDLGVTRGARLLRQKWQRLILWTVSLRLVSRLWIWRHWRIYWLLWNCWPRFLACKGLGVASTFFRATPWQSILISSWSEDEDLDDDLSGPSLGPLGFYNGREPSRQ